MYYSDDAILEQFSVWMRARGLRERTIEERLAALSRFKRTQEKEWPEVEQEAIVRWLATFSTPATKSSYFSHLRVFFHWMKVNKIRADDPVDELDSPRRPKSYPRPVPIAHVEDVLGQGRLYRKTRAMILLATYAGLRVHEIAKIHGRDYDSLNGILWVVGKGGKRAGIPLHPYLVHFFRSWPEDDWWFPSINGRGGHITSKSVSTRIHLAFRRAGYNVQPHQLRHTFATQLVSQHVDISVVQHLMRHENLTSTSIYIGIDMAQLREGVSHLSIS